MAIPPARVNELIEALDRLGDWPLLREACSKVLEAEESLDASAHPETAAVIESLVGLALAICSVAEFATTTLTLLNFHIEQTQR